MWHRFLYVFLWISEIKQIYTPGGYVCHLCYGYDEFEIDNGIQFIIEDGFFFYIFLKAMWRRYGKRKFMQMMRHYRILLL